MRIFALAVAAAALAVAPLAGAQAPVPATALPAPADELSVVDAITLGAIEGFTEFLPISSTGHLVIATNLLGLNSEQPIFDRAGEPLWHRKASATQAGELLTVRLAADTYIFVIQFGAVGAVALLCWPELLSMLRGLFGRDPVGRRLLITVLMAFMPAAIIGLLIHDWIDENLFSVGAVIFALIAGALLMFFAEYWYGRRYLRGILPETRELTPLAAIGIGILQCVAMWPGTSRPMMAIVGGYFAGLDPRRSAEFSFLLGFVTLGAASVYKSYSGGAAVIQVFGWPHVLLGAIVAAITAAASVRFFVQLLLRYGLNVFAWYRLALAVVLAENYYG